MLGIIYSGYQRLGEGGKEELVFKGYTLFGMMKKFYRWLVMMAATFTTI